MNQPGEMGPRKTRKDTETGRLGEVFPALPNDESRKSVKGFFFRGFGVFRGPLFCEMKIDRRGFTLIELLVTVAIVAVLAALVFSAVNSVRRSGAMAREVSAARQLVAGYLRAATDRNGEFMIGYAASEGATDERGDDVPNPACGRYPWRLAPYLQYRMQGIFLVNEQEHLMKIKDHADFVYRASASPSLGINATFVGGNERTGLVPSPITIKTYGNFVATRLSQVAQPAKLIVFASTRYTGEATGGYSGEKEEGFHLLTAPHTNKVEWTGPYDEKQPSEKFGHLHLRYNGRAVCAALAGNVDLLDEHELQDMRRWSIQAAEADEPDYIIKK
jgi:prepilin-type N-terminal cleavage/methylation domain-containing protein